MALILLFVKNCDTYLKMRRTLDFFAKSSTNLLIMRQSHLLLGVLIFNRTSHKALRPTRIDFCDSKYLADL